MYDWISVSNPDDPDGMPSYEGAPGDAGTVLIAGKYDGYVYGPDESTYPAQLIVDEYGMSWALRSVEWWNAFDSFYNGFVKARPSLDAFGTSFYEEWVRPVEGLIESVISSVGGKIPYTYVEDMGGGATIWWRADDADISGEKRRHAFIPLPGNNTPGQLGVWMFQRGGSVVEMGPHINASDEAVISWITGCASQYAV